MFSVGPLKTVCGHSLLAAQSYVIAKAKLARVIKNAFIQSIKTILPDHEQKLSASNMNEGEATSMYDLT